MGRHQIEEGHGPAILILPNGTEIHIKAAIYAPRATRSLLSFKDIRTNDLHIQTNIHDSEEVLQIFTYASGQKIIKEILKAYPLGYYATHTYCYHTETTPDLTELWHRRLGHLGTSMFHRIVNNSHGIPNSVHPRTFQWPCLACSQGKFITSPSPSKTDTELPRFLERLHVDVCGPIEPPSGPFRFFLVVIDASSKWSRVSLLSTRNQVFSRLLAHIIRLRSQFPEYPIRTLRTDGAGEFTSKTFEEFCLINGIDCQYNVPYVHFQNGMAESLIKRIQLVARPLLMQTNLPATAWGHAVLHAASLLLYRPSSFNSISPHHLAYGTSPNIAHLRTFGCQVLVPVLGPKRTKLGIQRRKGIYVGFDSISIIRFMEPTTADVFKARFNDCHFYETTFPTLILTGEPNKIINKDFIWQATPALSPDPRTPQAEMEVTRILQLTKVMAEIPDAFADATNVTKSHIPAANTPSRIQIVERLASDQSTKPKRGRPVGAVDKQPRQRCKQPSSSTVPSSIPPTPAPATEQQPEISINYNSTGKLLDRTTMIPDSTFSFQISREILNLPDPKSVREAQKQTDWPEWQQAINSELDSLISRKVFGPISIAAPDQHLTGYRLIFVKKKNSKGETVRYKARLVAKGYTQIFGTDYDLTYSLIMDSTTYRYLISFALHHQLLMHQMDVVTAYLYGELDKVIYMEAPPELIDRVNYHSQPKKPALDNTTDQVQLLR